MQSGSSASLELDLEHYVVPSPATSAYLGQVYPANMAETPRYIAAGRNSSGTPSHVSKAGETSSRPAAFKVCSLFTNMKCNNQFSDS